MILIRDHVVLLVPGAARVHHGHCGQSGGSGNQAARGGELRGHQTGAEPQPEGHRCSQEEMLAYGQRAEEGQRTGQEERSEVIVSEIL